jgi:hypothetical protein
MKRTQQGFFGKRLKIWRKQRSAGHHFLGPIYFSTEYCSHEGVRFINLTVGNPRVHYRWAFNAYYYLTGV